MGKPAGRVGDIGSGHGAYPPTPVVSGSPNVFTNNRPAARKGDSVLLHAAPKKPPHGRSIAAGSGTVFINGKPAARVGDGISCGGSVSTGSGNVAIGDSPQFKKPYTLPPVTMPWDKDDRIGNTTQAPANKPLDAPVVTQDGEIVKGKNIDNDTDVRVEGQSPFANSKDSAIRYWAHKKEQADDFPGYLAAHLMQLNAETGYSIAEGLQATYETVTDWEKTQAVMNQLVESAVNTVSDPKGTYENLKQAAIAFNDLPLSEKGDTLYQGMLGIAAGGSLTKSSGAIVREK